MLRKLGFSVINAGERAMKLGFNGKTSFINGPKFIFHPLSNIRILNSVTASDGEFIKTVKLNGEVDHFRGPVQIFENPLEITKITKEAAFNIPYNEALCVYHKDNEGNILTNIYEGPYQYVPKASDFRFDKINQFTCPEHRYFKVEYVDGKIEHFPGPKTILLDRRFIKEISICDPIFLNSNELMVVYKHQVGDKQGFRKIIKGKQYYIPEPDETIHEFSWSGKPKGSNFNIKVPFQRTFKVLYDMPLRMYYDILDVRTEDHILVNVKLIIFYEFNDFEKMLDNTNDPISNITSEVNGCVLRILSKLSFEQFKAHVKNMNDMNQYKELEQLEKQVGIKVTKITMTGYDAPQILQKIHNDAMEEKTKIELKKEIIKSDEENKSFKLSQEMLRHQKELELSMDKVRADIAQKKAIHEFELVKNKAEEDSEHRRLSKLKEIGVDLSGYLLKADKRIDIRTDSLKGLIVNSNE